MLVQVKARGDTFGGLEHLGCLSIFHSSNFCLNCQKRWYLACTRCNLDKRSQIKFFRLPKITNQLLTFQPKLQASIFQYWLTASQSPSSCAQFIRFSWQKRYHSLTLSHKLYVLCHKSLRDISPRIGYHKERPSLHVRAILSRAAEPDIDIGESANQAFSSGNTGPQRRVARMGHDEKTDAIFSVYFTKCFRSKSENVSETKIKIFWNENVFIQKTFAKRKCFRNESKIVLVFEMKRF